MFSLPIFRIVDSFAGATNAMRYDVSLSSLDKSSSMAYGNENLEPCVGECVVAFCAAMLTNAINAGEDAASVLNLASVGARTIESFGNLDMISEDELWGRK